MKLPTLLVKVSPRTKVQSTLPGVAGIVNISPGCKVPEFAELPKVIAVITPFVAVAVTWSERFTPSLNTVLVPDTNPVPPFVIPISEVLLAR